MKVDRAVRIVIALLIVVLLLGLSAGLLFVSESALNVWARLQTGPAVLRYGFVGALITVILLCVYLVVRFVVPRRRETKPRTVRPVDEASVRERLSDADARGMTVGAAQHELNELARRRDSNTVHLCLFGEISSGKSSLIRALLPDAD
ncbi:MAG: hypothetical protein AAFU65_16965, partial [Pseudomonadota bacterium]